MSYMFDYKTVSTPRVMPPKPAQKRIPPASMADLMADANRINAAARRAWGENGNQHFGKSANRERIEIAEARYEKLAIVLPKAMRARGAMTGRQVMQAFGLSEDVAYRTLRRMRDEGIIKRTSKGWVAV